MDLDGTVRPDGGKVSAALMAQFASLRRKGIKVLLVTGRSAVALEPLIDTRAFDLLVLENGALLRMGGDEKILSEPDWEPTRRKLLQVFPTTGAEKVIIALRRESEPEVRALLAPDGAHIELNKDAMMILPRGVSKGSGLVAALKVLDISPRDVMCIGDGENDVALLRAGGLKVAVRNAVPELKAVADYVTEAEDGDGVSEAISLFCGASG